jgi:hypothetical protein
VANETLGTINPAGILIVHEDVLVRYVLSAALVVEKYFVVAAVDRAEATPLISSFQNQIRLLIVSEASIGCPRFDQACLVVTEATRDRLCRLARKSSGVPALPDEILGKVRTALESGSRGGPEPI